MLDVNGDKLSKLDVLHLKVFSYRAYVTIAHEDRVKS